MGNRGDNSLLFRRLAAAGIAAAGIAAYSNTLSNAFVFLDVADIVDNPTIRHLGNLGRVLSPPAEGGLTVGGRPLVNLTLALNYAFGGTNVWGYHALNLLIHVLAGLTLFGVVRRTASRSTLFAFAVALLWTVHPLQTESVSYVVQRAESLMGLFYLLTLYCFIRYADETARNSDETLTRSAPRTIERNETLASERSGTRQRFVNTWGTASVACCFLGMATKEVMVSAPVIVLLYDRTFISGTFAEAWRRHRGVLLGLAATWAVVAVLALGSGERGGTAGFGLGVSLGDYLLTQYPAILHYLRLAVWPDPLVFDYGAHWFKGLGEVMPAAVAVIGLAVLSLVALRRWPVVGFLGFWFFSILAPTSLVPGMSQTMADHRMYLALAPLAVGFVWALERWLDRRVELAVVLALAAALGFATFARNRDYRDNLAIWSDTVAKMPDRPRGHFYLGVALAAAARPEEAIREVEQALRLNPSYPEAYNELGIVMAKSGRTREAIADYTQALRLKPLFPNAHYNLGTALAGIGRYDEAVAEFRAALRITPEMAEAEDNLGGTLARMGQLGEALPHYQKAVELDPDQAKFYYDWGYGLQNAGRVPEAIDRYEQAIRLDPGYAEAHSNLGVALASTGRLPEAIAHFEEAAGIKPASVNAHYNLAGALTNAGRLPEAIAEYRLVLRLKPDYSDAHYHLASVLRAAGRPAEADAEMAESERLAASAEATAARGAAAVPVPP